MASIPPDPPFATVYERQAGDAFRRALSASSAELRALRPPLPQVRNRPRFGYPSYPDRVPTLRSILGRPHWGPQDTPTNEVAAGMYQGSARNTIWGH